MAANFIIEGRRLCTVALHVPNYTKFEWSCFS